MDDSNHEEFLVFRANSSVDHLLPERPDLGLSAQLLPDTTQHTAISNHYGIIFCGRGNRLFALSTSRIQPGISGNRVDDALVVDFDSPIVAVKVAENDTFLLVAAGQKLRAFVFGLTAESQTLQLLEVLCADLPSIPEKVACSATSLQVLALFQDQTCHLYSLPVVGGLPDLAKYTLPMRPEPEIVFERVHAAAVTDEGLILLGRANGVVSVYSYEPPDKACSSVPAFFPSEFCFTPSKQPAQRSPALSSPSIEATGTSRAVRSGLRLVVPPGSATLIRDVKLAPSTQAIIHLSASPSFAIMAAYLDKEQDAFNLVVWDARRGLDRSQHFLLPFPAGGSRERKLDFCSLYLSHHPNQWSHLFLVSSSWCDGWAAISCDLDDSRQGMPPRDDHVYSHRSLSQIIRNGVADKDETTFWFRWPVLGATLSSEDHPNLAGALRIDDMTAVLCPVGPLPPPGRGSRDKVPVNRLRIMVSVTSALDPEPGCLRLPNGLVLFDVSQILADPATAVHLDPQLYPREVPIGTASFYHRVVSHLLPAPRFPHMSEMRFGLSRDDLDIGPVEGDLLQVVYVPKSMYDLPSPTDPAAAGPSEANTEAPAQAEAPNSPLDSPDSGLSSSSSSASIFLESVAQRVSDLSRSSSCESVSAMGTPRSGTSLSPSTSISSLAAVFQRSAESEVGSAPETPTGSGTTLLRRSSSSARRAAPGSLVSKMINRFGGTPDTEPASAPTASGLGIGIGRSAGNQLAGLASPEAGPDDRRVVSAVLASLAEVVLAAPGSPSPHGHRATGSMGRLDEDSTPLASSSAESAAATSPLATPVPEESLMLSGCPSSDGEALSLSHDPSRARDPAAGPDPPEWLPSVNESLLNDVLPGDSSMQELPPGAGALVLAGSEAEATAVHEPAPASVSDAPSISQHVLAQGASAVTDTSVPRSLLGAGDTAGTGRSASPGQPLNAGRAAFTAQDVSPIQEAIQPSCDFGSLDGGPSAGYQLADGGGPHDRHLLPGSEKELLTESTCVDTTPSVLAAALPSQEAPCTAEAPDMAMGQPAECDGVSISTEVHPHERAAAPSELTLDGGPNMHGDDAAAGGLASGGTLSPSVGAISASAGELLASDDEATADMPVETNNSGTLSAGEPIHAEGEPDSTSLVPMASLDVLPLDIPPPDVSPPVARSSSACSPVASPAGASPTGVSPTGASFTDVAITEGTELLPGLDASCDEALSSSRGAHAVESGLATDMPPSHGGDDVATPMGEPVATLVVSSDGISRRDNIEHPSADDSSSGPAGDLAVLPTDTMMATSTAPSPARSVAPAQLLSAIDSGSPTISDLSGADYPMAEGAALQIDDVASSPGSVFTDGASSPGEASPGDELSPAHGPSSGREEVAPLGGPSSSNELFSGHEAVPTGASLEATESAPAATSPHGDASPLVDAPVAEESALRDEGCTSSMDQPALDSTDVPVVAVGHVAGNDAAAAQVADVPGPAADLASVNRMTPDSVGCASATGKAPPTGAECLERCDLSDQETGSGPAAVSEPSPARLPDATLSRDLGFDRDPPSYEVSSIESGAAVGDGASSEDEGADIGADDGEVPVLAAVTDVGGAEAPVSWEPVASGVGNSESRPSLDDAPFSGDTSPATGASPSVCQPACESATARELPGACTSDPNGSWRLDSREHSPPPVLGCVEAFSGDGPPSAILGAHLAEETAGYTELASAEDRTHDVVAAAQTVAATLTPEPSLTGLGHSAGPITGEAAPDVEAASMVAEIAATDVSGNLSSSPEHIPIDADQPADEVSSPIEADTAGHMASDGGEFALNHVGHLGDVSEATSESALATAESDPGVLGLLDGASPSADAPVEVTPLAGGPLAVHGMAVGNAGGAISECLSEADGDHARAEGPTDTHIAGHGAADPHADELADAASGFVADTPGNGEVCAARMAHLPGESAPPDTAAVLDCVDPMSEALPEADAATPYGAPTSIGSSPDQGTHSAGLPSLENGACVDATMVSTGEVPPGHRGVPFDGTALDLAQTTATESTSTDFASSATGTASEGHGLSPCAVGTADGVALGGGAIAGVEAIPEAEPSPALPVALADPGVPGTELIAEATPIPEGHIIPGPSGIPEGDVLAESDPSSDDEASSRSSSFSSSPSYPSSVETQSLGEETLAEAAIPGSHDDAPATRTDVADGSIAAREPDPDNQPASLDPKDRVLDVQSGDCTPGDNPTKELEPSCTSEAARPGDCDGGNPAAGPTEPASRAAARSLVASVVPAELMAVVGGGFVSSKVSLESMDPLPCVTPVSGNSPTKETHCPGSQPGGHASQAAPALQDPEANAPSTGTSSADAEASLVGQACVTLDVPSSDGTTNTDGLPATEAPVSASDMPSDGVGDVPLSGSGPAPVDRETLGDVPCHGAGGSMPGERAIAGEVACTISQTPAAGRPSDRPADMPADAACPPPVDEDVSSPGARSTGRLITVPSGDTSPGMAEPAQASALTMASVEDVSSEQCVIDVPFPDPSTTAGGDVPPPGSFASSGHSPRDVSSSDGQLGGALLAGIVPSCAAASPPEVMIAAGPAAVACLLPQASDSEDPLAEAPPSIGPSLDGDTIQDGLSAEASPAAAGSPVVVSGAGTGEPVSPAPSPTHLSGDMPSPHPPTSELATHLDAVRVTDRPSREAPACGAITGDDKKPGDRSDAEDISHMEGQCARSSEPTGAISGRAALPMADGGPELLAHGVEAVTGCAIGLPSIAESSLRADSASGGSPPLSSGRDLPACDAGSAAPSVSEKSPLREGLSTIERSNSQGSFDAPEGVAVGKSPLRREESSPRPGPVEGLWSPLAGGLDPADVSLFDRELTLGQSSGHSGGVTPPVGPISLEDPSSSGESVLMGGPTSSKGHVTVVDAFPSRDAIPDMRPPSHAWHGPVAEAPASIEHLPPGEASSPDDTTPDGAALEPGLPGMWGSASGPRQNAVAEPDRGLSSPEAGSSPDDLAVSPRSGLLEESAPTGSSESIEGEPLSSEATSLSGGPCVAARSSADCLTGDEPVMSKVLSTACPVAPGGGSPPTEEAPLEGHVPVGEQPGLVDQTVPNSATNPIVGISASGGPPSVAQAFPEHEPTPCASMAGFPVSTDTGPPSSMSHSIEGLMGAQAPARQEADPLAEMASPAMEPTRPGHWDAVEAASPGGSTASVQAPVGRAGLDTAKATDLAHVCHPPGGDVSGLPGLPSAGFAPPTEPESALGPLTNDGSLGPMPSACVPKAPVVPASSLAGQGKMDLPSDVGPLAYPLCQPDTDQIRASCAVGPGSTRPSPGSGVVLPSLDSEPIPSAHTSEAEPSPSSSPLLQSPDEQHLLAWETSLLSKGGHAALPPSVDLSARCDLFLAPLLGSAGESDFSAALEMLAQRVGQLERHLSNPPPTGIEMPPLGQLADGVNACVGLWPGCLPPHGEDLRGPEAFQQALQLACEIDRVRASSGPVAWQSPVATPCAGRPAAYLNDFEDRIDRFRTQLLGVAAGLSACESLLGPGYDATLEQFALLSGHVRNRLPMVRQRLQDQARRIRMLELHALLD
ncbi:hypothetical protein H696_02393 [Fonticula alba]|uniref:Uncharacterized protein n=1 Tax=Fonticula alba TaxID=691883 RepID=A0A058ZBZ0_FONAL|nr:hypothetical protein H696_02393 [Fonticula alba]KCV71446.1 hypothetical protein H696_02393 [Fonticula alba]|eukprot:XP_009494569.1 hypothetical protein H696_02393 [Fonticula alba]